MLTRHAAALALGVALLAAGGCSPSATESAKTLAVRREALEVTFEETGVIESGASANVTAPFPATVLRIIDTGTMVRPGDEIALLDTAKVVEDIDREYEQLLRHKNDYERQIEELKMSIRSNALEVDSRAGELDYQRLRLEELNRELSRLQTLRREEVVAEDDMQDALNREERGRLTTKQNDHDFRAQLTDAAKSESATMTDLQRTHLQSRQAGEDLQKRIDELKGSRLLATTSGVFQRRSQWSWQRRQRAELAAGENIGPGELLGTISGTSNLRVKSQVPESRVALVREGMPLRLRFDSLGGLETSGTLVRIARAAVDRERSTAGSMTTTTEFSGQRVFEVDVEFTSEDPRVRPGLAARVSYPIEARSDVVAIPVEAVWTRSGKHVVAIRSGGEWVARDVMLGLRTRDRVEVLSGLVAGDTILATDPRSVLDQELLSKTRTRRAGTPGKS